MTMHSQSLNRRRWLFASALSFVTIAGCGGVEAPKAAEQDQARQTLDRALTSWQEGKTVEALKTSNPSILVSDPAWSRGDELKKFEVADAGKPSGAEREFTVSLWVAAPGGKKEKREQVVYRVGTDPILTVFRALF
jgi:hypothetical protein